MPDLHPAPVWAATAAPRPVLAGRGTVPRSVAPAAAGRDG